MERDEVIDTLFYTESAPMMMQSSAPSVTALDAALDVLKLITNPAEATKLLTDIRDAARDLARRQADLEPRERDVKDLHAWVQKTTADNSTRSDVLTAAEKNLATLKAALEAKEAEQTKLGAALEARKAELDELATQTEARIANARMREQVLTKATELLAQAKD